MAGLADYLMKIGTESIKPVAEEVVRKAGKLVSVAGSAAGQSYVRQFFDSGVWDEGMFDDKEKDSLSALVKGKLADRKSGFSYKDYDEEGGKNISYKGGVPDLSDPRKSLKMTLGKASIVRDDQNNVMVVDEYDFDSSKGLEKLPVGERIQALIDAARSDDVSTYGVAHLFAEAFGSTAGKGASIRANVGNAQDFGLSPEDIAYLPTLEEYQKQNKGRIKDRPVTNNIPEPVQETAAAIEPEPVQKQEPEKFTVKSGDTLSQLAKKYGTTVDALAKANGIEDVNKIYSGQELTLPEQQLAEGSVEEGFQFLGGDPADKANWKAVA